MPQYTLQQFAEITGGTLQGKGNTVIEHLETDSRNINIWPGSIFIAIKGPRHDGHAHILELIEKGICSFLVERHAGRLLEQHKVNGVIVNNTVEAMQQIAAHYRNHLSMPVIGITGSNGTVSYTHLRAHET